MRKTRFAYQIPRASKMDTMTTSIYHKLRTLPTQAHLSTVQIDVQYHFPKMIFQIRKQPVAFTLFSPADAGSQHVGLGYG